MSYHNESFRVTTGLLTVALLALAGAACEGPQFGGADKPTVDEFNVSPSTATEGDTLRVQIRASGDRDVERVRLEFSGAFSKDTTFAVVEPNTSITDSARVVVPTGTTNPALAVVATVFDIADTASETTEAVNVTIEDATPPTVSATPSPSAVGSGETVDIAVNASDNRGIAVLRLDVTNNVAFDTVLVDTLANPTRTYSQTWQLLVPDLPVGSLEFTPSVIDINNLQGNGESSTVEISDRTGPRILSLQTLPDSTIPLEDSLQVTVEVSDPAGIQRITMFALAERGNPSMGTDSVVVRFASKTIELPRPTQPDTLPKRFTFNPYLQPTDNETTEPVELFVIVEDSLGNVSDTTKLMYVGGPDVSITYPPDNFAVGVSSDFNVRMLFDDGTGIDSAKLVLGGDLNQTIDLTLPPRTDTAFVVAQNVTMPGAEGSVTLRAVAWNPSEVQGQSRLVEVAVLAAAPTDTVPPTVTVTAERLTPGATGARMELLDELRVRVSAFDGNAGLARIGLKIIAGRGNGVVDTVTEDLTFAGSKSLEELTFQVPVDSLYTLLGITGDAVLDSILPENLDLRIHGFAADTTNQFACSVGFEEQRSCRDNTYSPTEFYEASDTSGLGLRVEAVRGTTVLLDNTEAIIADLAVDTVDERVFMSNVTENLVEFLQLQTDPRAIAFEDPVQVGSEPLGVFLGDRVVRASEPGFGISATPGDTARTLLVANSGGTNLSLVHLEANAANVQEVDIIRLRTPNAVLFQLEESTDDFGNVQYTGVWIDLADRPQYLAQDSLLRIVFSTRSTSQTDVTTVRYILTDPDPTSTTDEPEVRYLLNDDMVDPDNETSLALANIDSVDFRAIAGGSDLVRLYTHEPGYPDNVIFNTPYLPLIEDARDSIIAQLDAIMTARGIPNQAPMYYPFLMRGVWDFDAISWGDTTFVSASGDRGKIAIGEGAKTPAGRIMMWEANDRATYSDEIQIEDLVNNAAEVVLGVGLNENGSLGVARGNAATYFFTPDLRLQGLYRQADEGGAGATFHPEHDAIDDGGHTTTDGAGVAFTGTSANSIDVVNTFHFNQVNSIVIRDNIVGPLRAGPPLDSDNGGQGGQCVALAATEADRKDCIVAKVYGITSAGGVVIVNIRRRDLEPYATP